MEEEKYVTGDGQVSDHSWERIFDDFNMTYETFCAVIWDKINKLMFYYDINILVKNM